MFQDKLLTRHLNSSPRLRRNPGLFQQYTTTVTKKMINIMIKAKIFILKSTLKGDRHACKKGGAGPHNQPDDPPLRGGRGSR